MPVFDAVGDTSPVKETLLMRHRLTSAHRFTGLAWLFMGVANSDATLYNEELQEILATYPDQFRLDYALSREQNNKKGGKMYIQDKVEEYADEVFDLLDNGAHIFFCGLKGMMPGGNQVPCCGARVAKLVSFIFGLSFAAACTCILQRW